MFNGPGAKKYDFSHLNPLIVGGFILLICYFGSKNTYFDQFYRVSQLPEHRNELSIIKSFNSSLSSNKVVFNISLQFAFKITFENFRQSFAIKIDHYGFKSVHYHNNFFDYQLDANNYLSGFALSSIFGSVNISYYYLNEEIAQTQTNIPGISLLFPGNTIISKKEDHYHLSNVYISKRSELKLYFQTAIECDQNWLQFENGCSLPISLSKRPAHDECASEGQCVSYDRTTHLFVVPPSQSSYDLFISLFNPLTEFSKPSQDKVVVWCNSSIHDKAYQLIVEMSPLLGREIEILNSEHPNFFKELRIRNKISHNFRHLTRTVLKSGDFSDNFNENKLVIVTDESTKELITKEKSNDISSIICSKIDGGCNSEVIEFANNENVVSTISKAHFLILPKKKAHFIFPLKNGAKVFLISDQQTDSDDNDDNWINEMAKDILVDVKYVKYENGNLDTSVFNL